MKTLCIILPAFNEAEMLGSVLENLKDYAKTLHNLVTTIVVVDDGSSDQTSSEAKKHRVIVLRHVLNRGLGAALATGLEYAKKNNFDIALTMDSDGQHDCRDIAIALKPILAGKADVVIGSRMLGQKGMPKDRIILNFLSNILTWILFRHWSSDSQSGFRVLNKSALHSIVIKTQGMEVSSEFFSEIKANRLIYTEVPIRVIYSDYSRKKGQSNLNSVNILAKLFLRIFR